MSTRRGGRRSRTDRTKAANSSFHAEIRRQAEIASKSGKGWRASDYPHLYSLLRAAIEAARTRTRLKGRILFEFRGRQYAARFTNLDRVIVEERSSGKRLAASGIFAL